MLVTVGPCDDCRKTRVKITAIHLHNRPTRWLCVDCLRQWEAGRGLTAAVQRDLLEWNDQDPT